MGRRDRERRLNLIVLLLTLRTMVQALPFWRLALAASLPFDGEPLKDTLKLSQIKSRPPFLGKFAVWDSANLDRKASRGSW